MTRMAALACVVLATLSCAEKEPPAPAGPAAQRRAPAADVAKPTVPVSSRSAGPRERSVGQTLYVPVYSHVYYGPKARPFNLACTLSVRSTDLDSTITLTAVDYYDSSGRLLGHYLDQERQLGPLETVEFYVEEQDVEGGSGANFIVRWEAAEPVNGPVVEVVMIGFEAAQGISFVTTAREIVD